jgi:hypothetical protein
MFSSSGVTASRAGVDAFDHRLAASQTTKVTSRTRRPATITQ